MMKLRRKKKILLGFAGGIICILIIFLGMLLLNKNTLELSVKDGDVIHFEYGNETNVLDIEAKYKGSIFNKKGTQVEVFIEGDVDYNSLGEYKVRVSASHKKLSAAADVYIIVEDTLPPVIELVSDPEYFTNPSAEYVEEGFLALDNYDGILTEQVVREELDGVIRYTVTDSAGNTAVVERTIVYKDAVAPVVSLKGEEKLSLNIGTAFVDPGYSANDECDGDLTQSVVVEGTVDCNVKGVYEITYHVKDSAGNLGKVIRTVKVEDISAPVMKLHGESEMYIQLGGSYTEKGVTANDNVDGDLSSQVKTSGKVDTKKAGNYTIKYTVKDSSGNEAAITRKVFVYDKQAENIVVNPGDKVIYLTFDDGPGPYTERLLDILDKYGVKVTFFVTAQSRSYLDMIGEAHRRGHTIAIHTYSHRFEEIYASPDSYYNDLEKMKNICVEQTGVEPSILRFPGGTANTVSRKYCTGIMSSISNGVGYRGYLYCDWNVDSGDAAGAKTASKVAQNVIDGVKGKTVSIVLQHDIKQYSVEAVEEIVCWGMANGYKFLPMDITSPMIHQTVKN